MPENPIPLEYKSDHLFLLIGTNPLPNYVAAKLLLKPGGIVYLVHSDESSGTTRAALRLESLLRNEELINQPVKIQVDEARAADIFAKLTWETKKIKSGTVGLNYTGGTKVMAVHAHRALRQAAEQQKLTAPVCSYLDARTYEMLFDPIGMDNPAGKPVLLAAPLNLIELLRLHDIELREGAPSQSPILLASATELIKLHADKMAAEQWRCWCEKELKAKTWRILDKANQLKSVSLVWPTDTIFAPVATSICRELNLPVFPEINLGESSIKQKFGQIKYFCKWLDGVWLENYVLNQVEQVANKCQLNDYGMSLDTDSKKVSLDFEFDVAAMRGYQLFGISCSTTTTKALAKSKLFEAFVRARQLGGDEARVGLVCAYSRPEELEREIEKTWDISGKLKVFGPEHFEELKDHLAVWFTEPPKKG